MKKYLITAIIALSLYSCGYASLDTTKPAIVTDIESTGDGITCRYYGKGNLSTTVFICSYNFCIIDSVGKYNVGDTIKLTK